MGGNCMGIYSIYRMQPSPYIWVMHGMVDPFGGTTTKPSLYLGNAWDGRPLWWNHHQNSKMMNG
jgi:hypothetical protein